MSEKNAKEKYKHSRIWVASIIHKFAEKIT